MQACSAAIILTLAAATPAAAQQSFAPSCSKADECVAIVRQAIAQSDFERAHDTAWRAVRLGQRNDASLMLLLARTQSLVGRPHDAIVMLRRIVALGFRPDGLERDEDFRRVRSLPAWADLETELRNATTAKSIPALMEASTSTASTTPEGSGKTASPAPDPRGAPSSPASPGATAPSSPAPSPPSEPPVAGSAKAASKPSVPAGLRVPTAPVALAYDSVSARFVVTDESSDTLKIVDERTGNVIDLVSPGWAGAYRPAAIAIDARRGELWAAGVDATGATPRSTIYKLQLVSGRLLQTIPFPEDAGPAGVVDVAVGRSAIFLLDGVGRRVFSIGEGAATPRVVASLETLGHPVSLAAANDSVLYVAHAKGLARVDVNGRRLPVPIPAAADVSDILSISWHDGALFAIQRNGTGQSAARIRLDARGMAVMAVETLDPALSRAAGVYSGVFYYVTRDADGSIMLRGRRAR